MDNRETVNEYVDKRIKEFEKSIVYDANTFCWMVESVKHIIDDIDKYKLKKNEQEIGEYLEDLRLNYNDLVNSVSCIRNTYYTMVSSHQTIEELKKLIDVNADNRDD